MEINYVERELHRELRDNERASLQFARRENRRVEIVVREIRLLRADPGAARRSFFISSRRMQRVDAPRKLGGCTTTTSPWKNVYPGASRARFPIGLN